MELASVALGFILLSAVVLCSVTIFSPQHSATVPAMAVAAGEKNKAKLIQSVWSKEGA